MEHVTAWADASGLHQGTRMGDAWHWMDQGGTQRSGPHCAGWQLDRMALDPYVW